MVTWTAAHTIIKLQKKSCHIEIVKQKQKCISNEQVSKLSRSWKDFHWFSIQPIFTNLASPLPTWIHLCKYTENPACCTDRTFISSVLQTRLLWYLPFLQNKLVSINHTRISTIHCNVKQQEDHFSSPSFNKISYLMCLLETQAY